MNITTAKAAILLTAAVGLGAASLANAAAGDAPRVLEVRDFAGRIEVDTSVGGPLRATVTPGTTGLGASVTPRGTDLVVDGDISNRRMSCHSRDGQREYRINGRTYAADQLPVLRVTGDSGIGVRIVRSAVEGRIGNVGGATLSTIGCGDLTVGNVRRDAEVNLAGSGNIALGNVGGDLELNLAGAGDVSVGTIGGRTEVNLAGSGDVRVARSGRDLDISIAGSGDVRVAAGESQTDVSIAGSGDVEMAGTAIDPSVSIIGSGDVRLVTIRGERRFSRIGSGSVREGSR
jgi:hypothetical protein